MVALSKAKVDKKKEFLHTMVSSALTIEFERLQAIDLQTMAGLDEGNISRQIRNIHDRVNRTYSILKYNPIIVDGKERTLIEADTLEQFNDLFEDFLTVQDLRTKCFDPNQASYDLSETYDNVFVPKYEKQVNELLKKESNQTWKDIEYSDIYLRKYLLKQIMRLGHELQGQVSLALVQTLPREEIDRLTRSLAAQRQQWEG